MKEIQFPKDFSNIVTKLLSESGDFASFNKETQYQYLKGINKELKNAKDDAERNSILSKIPGSNVNLKDIWRDPSKPLTSDEFKAGYKSLKGERKAFKAEAESKNTGYDISHQKNSGQARQFEAKAAMMEADAELKKEQVTANKEAREAAKKAARSPLQKLSDYTNDTMMANGGTTRADGQSDLDYVSKNIGEAARITTENLKNQIPNLRKAGANAVDSLFNLKHDKSAKLRQSADEWRQNGDAFSNWWAKRKDKKAAKIERKERSDALGRFAGNVGNAISLGLDTISSRHRAQTLAEGGQAALLRKKAKLAKWAGDDSLATSIAAGSFGGGSWNSGLGVRGLAGKGKSFLIDRLNPVSARIRSTQKNYQRQLQYMNSLQGYDYSEQDNLPQVEPLSWQPEEYEKLNFLLNRDYENQEDFSEQIGEQDLGFYDASKIVDISSLTPEKAESLLTKSYYKVSDEEKRYQESIAKGFSEEYKQQKSYENFLNECSEIYDSTSWR